MYYTWFKKPDRFNRELAFKLVRLWSKTRNDLKTRKIKKLTGSAGKLGTSKVKLVNDWLGFVDFSWPKNMPFWSGT